MTFKKFNLPSLEHLQRLTDDTGIAQHAKFIIPDRRNGYCTDDNARALIAVCKYMNYYPADKQARKLFDIYLAFIYHALKPDKTVYNFMDYNRSWEALGKSEHDALGRTIWALGAVIASPLKEEDYIPIVREFFYDTSKHISMLSPRGAAYAILGLAEFLKKFPQDEQGLKLLKAGADILAKNYNECSSAKWDWFEEILAYANSIMPAAMYAAAKILNNSEYLVIAENTCSFVIENTFNGDHFSFIGSNGWHPKHKKRAQFDQQPIEAGDTVIMLANAYMATKNKKYFLLQKKAFGWFLGENDIHKPLYDPQTKGCRDGLGADYINLNQGAESTISFLLAQLFLIK